MDPKSTRRMDESGVSSMNRKVEKLGTGPYNSKSTVNLMKGRIDKILITSYGQDNCPAMMPYLLFRLMCVVSILTP